MKGASGEACGDLSAFGGALFAIRTSVRDDALHRMTDFPQVCIRTWRPASGLKRFCNYREQPYRSSKNISPLLSIFPVRDDYRMNDAERKALMAPIHGRKNIHQEKSWRNIW